MRYKHEAFAHMPGGISENCFVKALSAVLFLTRCLQQIENVFPSMKIPN
jgi:hypothetical protein